MQPGFRARGGCRLCVARLGRNEGPHRLQSPKAPRTRAPDECGLAFLRCKLALHSLGAIAYLDYAGALERSLIPVELDATLLAKRIAHEKHPGIDDAHLVELRLGDGQTETLEVDAPVFAAIGTGDRLRESRGERLLRINARSLDLEPSSDAKAMRILIAPFFGPAALAVGLRSWVRDSGG